MTEAFRFRLSTDMQYGFESSLQLGIFLKDKGYKEVCVLVDEAVSKTEYYKEVFSRIRKEISKLEVLPLRGTEEPSYDYLDMIAEKVRAMKTLDAVVGIGGGSTLDMTKAVAALKTNSGKGVQYRGFDHVKVPGIPSVLIPTTAGTASEVTINAVFIDKDEKRKLGINGNFMFATFAFLDAKWTLSCPLSVAVSAGVDAMVHALESFKNPKANIVTRSFSRLAVRLLVKNLECLVRDPQNIEQRQELLLGSYFAGIALFNSGSGVAGAMSYPIGVHYQVPHGIGGGIFINSVLEFNIKNGCYVYADLFDEIVPGAKLTPKEKSEKFHQILVDLFAKLQVPRTLTKWGITRANVESVAKLMIPMQAAFDQNPVKFSAEKDALEVLKKHVE